MSDEIPMILSVDDLARIVHKSPASIRSDASRNPSALPPICRLPGNKRLLWRMEDVASWLAGCVDRTTVVVEPAISLASTGLKRRGRPRKTEARSVA